MPTPAVRRSFVSVVTTLAVVTASLLLASPAEAVRPLRAPDLIAPADGSFQSSTTFPIDWTALVLADSYTAQLSSRPDVNILGNLKYVEATFSDLGTHLDGPVAEGTWYWQVRGVNQDGNGPWSDVGKVTVDVTDPVVQLSSPVAGSDYKPGDTVTVSGTASDNLNLRRVAANVHDAAGEMVDNIDATSAATSLGSSNYSNTISYVLPATLADGTYYIRAAATDETGNTGVVEVPIIVDGTAPVITVDSHAPNAVLHGTETISGTATDNLSGISSVRFLLRGVKLNGALQNTILKVTAPVVGGRWSVSLDTAAHRDLGLIGIDKGYGFTVAGSDAAGNEAGVNRAIVKPVTFDNSGPSTPVGLSPQGWQLSSEAFTWAASTDLNGPVSYEVITGNHPNTNTDPASPDFGKLTSGVQAIGTTSATTFAHNLPTGPIFWQVRAKDGFGNYSAWSSPTPTQIIGTPVITSPVTGLSLSASTLTTTWTDVFGIGGVDRWEVDYFLDRDHDTVFEHEQRFVTGSPWVAGGTVSRTQQFTTDYQGDLYITVRAIYNIPFSPWDPTSDRGPWSNTVHVVRDSVGPNAPVQINPENGRMQSNPAPVLAWNQVADAVAYDVRASYDTHRTPANDNAGQLSTPNVAHDVRVTDTQYLLSGLNQGWIWWQVRAVDALGNVGPWSNIWATGVDTVQPAQVQLVAPAAQSTETTGSFDLRWLSVESGVTYTVQVSDNLTGPGPYNTSGLIYPLAGVPDGSYYWKVRATDTAGNVGAWSEPWKITVDTSVPVSPVTAFSSLVNTTTGGTDAGENLQDSPPAEGQQETLAVVDAERDSSDGSKAAASAGTTGESADSTDAVTWWLWLLAAIVAACLLGLALLLFRRRQADA
ncbi:hypothetical protein BH09ACT3_BH09ACT3_04930 [soil metagenome]